MAETKKEPPTRDQLTNSRRSDGMARKGGEEGKSYGGVRRVVDERERKCKLRCRRRPLGRETSGNLISLIPTLAARAIEHQAFKHGR
ncbi:hypothetical protein TRIUR3_30854 [Triticum urartu]|uniref:Uncharacterized protein n=1 Tax=Triticum urartu TaxID=4572 RepID=M7ZK61_TRIUA|nr:hypothetical protein TRIUR3_30854 [Triticum urartu]